MNHDFSGDLISEGSDADEQDQEVWVDDPGDFLPPPAGPLNINFDLLLSDDEDE
jgi:hypothetical protein